MNIPSLGSDSVDVSDMAAVFTRRLKVTVSEPLLAAVRSIHMTGNEQNRINTPSLHKRVRLTIIYILLCRVHFNM